MSARLVPLDEREGAREALVAAIALLVLLGGGKHLVAAVGFGEVFFTAVAAYQIYVPLWLSQRRGEAPEAYGIHAHGLLLGPVAALRARIVRGLRRRGRAAAKKPGPVRKVLALYGRGARFRPHELMRDVGLALVVALLTFPPFALAHHFWQLHFGAPGYTFVVPGDIVVTLLKNVFLIALPEEMFYRGLVEHRLERLWPTRHHVWIIPLGRTVFLASALFAVGHFLGEYNPARLGPFFPAFVFSGLTRRGKSITGAVLYHGMSNAFSTLLFAGYHH